MATKTNTNISSDIMYNYYFAYEDEILIRAGKSLPIQRFDNKSKEWVTDWDMCGIFSGDILSKHISLEEAEKMIFNN
ncbi:MAG TPA: hypothetical protein GX736_01325 [Mogibacterium sp.]|nr:hypothetical protein [Mogibacterium sp.]